MIYKVPDDGTIAVYPAPCSFCEKRTEVRFSRRDCLFPVTDCDDEKPMNYYNVWKMVNCSHCGREFRVGIKVGQNLPEREKEVISDDNG